MPLLHKLIISIATILLFLGIGDTLLELGYAFALILILGIPHGATDHLLWQNTGSQTSKHLPLWKFIVSYLAVMLAYVAVWYFFKTFAFVVFLAISAYHFGEAQLIKNIQNKRWDQVSYFLWGLSALLLIFFPHLSETKALIVPYLVDESAFQFFSQYRYYFLIGACTPLLFLFTFSSYKVLLHQFAELLLIYLISRYTSLLVAFAVFFSFWHAYDSTSFQLSRLRKSKKNFNLLSWVKKAAPYSAISWVGIILIISISLHLKLSWPLITLFFVLVSIITLPHVIIMSRFYFHPKTD
ncbi:MAG: Brp/Blh family beta-carotene 15,15'-monooxygenase [Cyclobacteriaceae bacterium]|jgi:Brp/Blh family beta-carotene 15,15'-monooxygenase